MAPRRGSFDDKLARISGLSKLGAAAAPELSKFLSDPSAFLVGEAARIVGELELRQLLPDLAAAFERLLSEGAAADRGCHVKKRILKILIELEAEDPRIYYAGLRYVQEEFAVKPPPFDTAGAIRAMCAIALVRFDAPGAVHDVVPLLYDELPEARIGAAEALRGTGDDLCAAILHGKILAGEPDADVVGACHRAMLALSPRRYLPIVGAALAEGVEAAALALGESRLPGALDFLKGALPTNPVIENTILLGIALLRSDEANAYLLELVAEAPEPRAAAALQALALHRHDAKIVEKAREAVTARRSRKLSKVFEEKMGQG